MHSPDLHQRAPAAQPPLVWLVSGTGEGPPLAAALLQRGWQVRVSVVSGAAARAYAAHPALSVAVGALGNDAAVAAQLQCHPPRWVIDASHPFAQRITAQLQAACQTAAVPLLRLLRPPVADAGERAELLAGLTALSQVDLSGQRLLLAVGARQLREALALSNASVHFARILDNPLSLQLALAAGLGDGQLACLRPGDGAVEEALLRRWRISAVLCRQSGGPSETLWRQLARTHGLRLLLLQRPHDHGLSTAALLEKLGAP